MAADFLVPLRYRHWVGKDGVIYWNATWNASNFAQATTVANWGELGMILLGKLVKLDALTLKVTAAGPGGLYRTNITTLPGSQQSMPWGEMKTAAYALDYLKFEGDFPYQVTSGNVSQVGLSIGADAYADTDDLVMYVTGRGYPVIKSAEDGK